MTFKLFEFTTQFMIDTFFLIKLTKYQKTGSLEKLSFRCEIWQSNSIAQIRSR